MLSEKHGFYGPVVRVRQRYFNAGFALVGADWEREDDLTDEWARFGRDVWQEFILADSAVVLWRDGGKPSVMHTEDVTYDDRGGVEKVTIAFSKAALTEEMRRTLGATLIAQIEKNGKITIVDGRTGTMNCRVLTRGKQGCGLVTPSVSSVMLDLAIWELLKIREWNGAFASRNVMRHAKKGHEIKSGNLAGQPLHFWKSAFAKQLLKALGGLSGYNEFSSNFDLNFEWVFLPGEFFDPKIFDSVTNRLMFWAGGAAMVAMATEERQDSRFANGLDMMRDEARESREMVRVFLTEILRQVVGKKFRGIEWSNTVFMPAKELKQFVAQAANNGHISPQTATEALGFNNQRERKRMLAAHQTPDAYSPPFEAKQGQSGESTAPTTEGGRPPSSNKPGKTKEK